MRRGITVTPFCRQIAFSDLPRLPVFLNFVSLFRTGDDNPSVLFSTTHTLQAVGLAN